jgi:hypothetical protein
MSDTTLSTGSTSNTLLYEGQRAHADYEAAAQALRAAAQATILINGGAATAIIAFLGRATPPPDSVVSAAAWALFFYALGIAAGPYAFWGISQAATLYASAWEGILTRDLPATSRQDRLNADQHVRNYTRYVIASIICFVVGSVILAVVVGKRGLQP